MNIEELERLIANDENVHLELKKTTGELKDGMHTACAFLNGAGGWLVFGVAPKSLKILGQEVTDNTQREIAQALSGLEPAVSVDIQYIDVPDRLGCQVIAMYFEAFVWGTAPYTYHGSPYYKVESTTKLMPRNMFEERLRANKPNYYAWERQTADHITIADMDEKLIRGALRLGVEKNRMPATALTEPMEDVLGKLELLNDGVPNNAAAALFSTKLRGYTQMQLRLARFRGTNKNEFFDNQRAYGNFFTLLDAGMAFFFKHLSISGKIVGFTREEKLEVPAEALREALTNALCHRFFHNTSSSVGIAIYDDRIEIENSGHLPEELTTKTIKQSHHSFPQNPTIADVLFKTTFLENWGSGVGRIMDACREANLPEPEYNQNASFVWVTFKREAIQPYNHTSSPYNHTTTQVHHTTSMHASKAKRLKKFLSVVGEKGANMKTLMEEMNLRNRSSFVNAYITPNLTEGYIAMLYPESPNHPMQSYYLTNKGREVLNSL